jgi:hypothetical protein
MNKQARTFVRLATTGLLLASPVLVSAGPERGQLLYENHCTTCHTSTAHIREQRKVKSPAELRAFIQRWSGEIKLTWSAEELSDIYQHLNNRYYKFPLATPAK